jgi:multiple antibiotic resistance protein
MWWQQRLSEFVTLLLVINPIGALPIYLAIAAPLAPPAQRKVAVSAVLISFAVLVFFIVAGEFLLGRMNIPIRAFQISGGIVLFLVAIEMIRGETPILAPKAKENHVALAVYPLAIPKIAGPGAMLTVIMLTDDDRLNIMGQLVTVGVLAAVLVIQLLVLLAAAPVSRLIGVAGAAVVSRVMGMLLAALAVSILLTALGQWLNLPQL